ncbi:geranylgeranyl diphosphate synthase, type I [Jatrophihabitans endophyticus]|uniref:Geranylgeranyl diphosphate synthase, type I n=1 Tax=Jatrophihabitans endophyticus TaxID=1206085 RepID=A0A1M5M9E8_9ACTN|nr:polyprenyl synthetase family protein [Jatrophihabitans endophyticus]SHG73845.1 geranylgeranyl diphosphate synthase, type I [Jatrophihabitans endophyticus]
MITRLDPTRRDETARPATPVAIDRARELVEPALHAAVDLLTDSRMRLIAGYQLGLWDAAGERAPGGRGKAVRPALVLLAARAVGGRAEAGVPGAVAVELVHNFSLLHDDIMDRDVERRHRPTGWVVYGEGQAILAGNAMLAAALETLLRDDPHHDRTVPALLACVQRLISGQSADLALERDDTAAIEDVLAMEDGKTAALIANSLELGALAAGADTAVVARLAEAGRLAGLAFQLVDDVLGVVGDASVTGKSSSSDIRAGKRSVPVVAALRSGTPEGDELADLLRAAPPETDVEVERAVRLVVTAGGLDWARREAERLLAAAHQELAAAGLGADTATHDAAQDLAEVLDFLVRRDW